MQRCITGYHLDREGHWVAELDCGHDQHVRHRPPWELRPWVMTDAGRREHLGTALECVRCARRELPEHAHLRRRTPTFDEASIPPALRARHATKPGVWARVHVLAGALDWEIDPPIDTRGRASAGEVVIMPPDIEHRVEPVGQARFFVELLDGRPG